jgi:hypothetical protein
VKIIYDRLTSARVGRSGDGSNPAAGRSYGLGGVVVEGVLRPPGWVGLKSGDWRKVLFATRQPCDVFTMSTVMSISSDAGAWRWLLAIVSSTTAKKLIRPPLFDWG